MATISSHANAKVVVEGDVKDIYLSPEHRENVDRLDVTVAICFASSAETIAETVQSLVAQTNCPPFELLLVSNATHDDSVRIAIEAAKGLPVRVVECESRGYDSNARNVCMRESAGSKILFLDADDTVDPDYVALMSAALDKNPLVTAHWEQGQLNRSIFPPRGNGRPETVELPFRHEGWTFSGAGTLGMQRHVAATIGGFRPELAYAANNEWCFRAYAAGFEITGVPGAYIHYRLRPGYMLQLKQRYRWGFFEIKAAELAFRYGMPRQHSSVGVKTLIRDALKARCRYDLYMLCADIGLLFGRTAGALHSRFVHREEPRAERAPKAELQRSRN